MNMPKCPIPCFVCEKVLENYSQNQPDNGLCFKSYGHYGTTYFDPMDASYLEINICDDCLVRNEKKILYLTPNGEITTPKQTFTRTP